MTSWAFGVARSTTSRPTGTIIAPPMPCSTRVPVRLVRSTAAAQPTEARVKIATALKNTRRAPNRSASHPLTGISTARVST